MLLKIVHQTDLTYSDLISESVMELRVAPRQESDQHRLSFTLGIGPPASVTGYFDWLGNTVHSFSINALHRKIRIVATSVVETDRGSSEPERFKDTWPLQINGDYSLLDYLAFGGPIVDSPALREVVHSLGAQPGMALGELALRMLHLINYKFQYETGITTSASPITEILEHGRGVCQDFTHLMIGLGRALGIPARYVSGLVHPEGQKFRGFTQTHAWCELYFPTQGWIGFDPTNDCIVGPNFIKVAIGRDFSDVSPNKGLYRGKATESIDVQVMSEELPTIPDEMAAERIEPLPMETYPKGFTLERVLAIQQQEHAQQQQKFDRDQQQQQQQQQQQ